MRTLLPEHRIAFEEIENVVIASVVPALSEALVGACRKYLDREPLLVDAGCDLGLPLRVHPPEAAGADRLANAVAARHHYGAPAVVVDLGTATTFDVIDDEGAYVGGAIAPGVHTAAEDLFRRAARLARVEIVAPLTAIGSTTEASLRSGIYLGTLAMVDGMLALIRAELKGEPAVIFTGGLSSPFQEAFRQRGTLAPFLTLEGLRLIHARSLKQGK